MESGAFTAQPHRTESIKASSSDRKMPVEVRQARRDTNMYAVGASKTDMQYIKALTEGERVIPTKTSCTMWEILLGILLILALTWGSIATALCLVSSKVSFFSPFHAQAIFDISPSACVQFYLKYSNR